MHWRLSTMTELEHLPDAVRDRILREHAGLRVYVIMLAWALFLAVLPAAVGLWAFGPSVTGWLGGGAVLLVLGGGVYQFQMIRIRGAMLTELLAAARAGLLPFCLRCGYNLTGNTSGTCPECGTVVSLPGRAAGG